MKWRESEVLFRLGRIVATPSALDALKKAGQGIWEFLRQHRAGDWGELDENDRWQNEYNLRQGLKLLSTYTLRTGVKLRIVTEAADENGYRSATTISVVSSELHTDEFETYKFACEASYDQPLPTGRT